MLFVVLFFCLFPGATGQQEDDQSNPYDMPSYSATGQQEDDWLDPHDMLNYGTSTISMKKPKEIDNLKKKNAIISQQPTCNPVFKRFLNRLLKEMNRVGLPSASADVVYDAKIQLSREALTEIQTFLNSEDSRRTGALDHAISQILVDLRPHDYKAWKWHFEDTFGVELYTLLQMGLWVLIISMIVCTQRWSTASWFVQFQRLLAICFIVSVVWNWFYLYKIAFAEHQNNVVKMDRVYEQCTGLKRFDWSDSLKEWFRSTWTLQDHLCKRYYEVLMVNPILLVPPTKAVAVTLTSFITVPLQLFGQGINEFTQALLKDLPFTEQILVLLTIVLAILLMVWLLRARGEVQVFTYMAR
ncbi:chloride channel CLIC-like protein 1 [Aulostomus maculatus]